MLLSIYYQIAEDNIDYEKDKKEDEAVAKKLTEIEEELKGNLSLHYRLNLFKETKAMV